MSATLRSMTLSATLLAALCAGRAWAAPAEFCFYLDDQGKIVQASSLARVPVSRRETAKCVSAKENTYLAKPQEIELKGTIRKEDMVSSLGQIELRWPRKVETLFGRTPQRAVAEAASVVNRALKSAGFPQNVQNLHLAWKIVFMDEDMPEGQIPAYLVSACHPAWMTPPTNIYVVAQKAAAGCGKEKVKPSEADAELTHILIHEMGHAVEYQLLRDQFQGDRMRAEGFASWFEQFGADFSSIIPKDSVRNLFLKAARKAIESKVSAGEFSGSFGDYARASMIFRAIELRRGVRGIMDVYSTMTQENLDFIPAIEKRLGWDASHLEAEIARAIK